MKFILVIIISLICNQVNAGKKYGEFAPLKGETMFNYQFDHKKMTIEGQNAVEFIYNNTKEPSGEAEKVFKRYMKRAELSFMAGVEMSDFKDDGYVFDNEKPHKFTMVISFYDVDDTGGHIVTINVVDNSSGNVIGSLTRNQLGKRGEFRNRFIERLTVSGEHIGNSFCDIMESINKKK